MGVTYTTAAQRGRQTRQGLALPAASMIDLRLAAVSLLALVLLFVAYQGRYTAIPGWSAAVNLNEVADARALEPAVSPLFDNAADARLAARELFAFLVQADGARRSLPNVGSLARARVPASAVDAAQGANAYRARLAAERSRAGEAKRAAPDSIPLFTAAQIAELKPSVVVRQPGEARSALLVWAVLYVAAFQGVALLWRRRSGAGGDPLLLVITHLLTAIGFALMVSRPDPLRDVQPHQRDGPRLRPGHSHPMG